MVREYSPPTTCHMSHVLCDVHLKQKNNGGTFWWRACYQRGLPRLVFKGIE